MYKHDQDEYVRQKFLDFFPLLTGLALHIKILVSKKLKYIYIHMLKIWKLYGEKYKKLTSNQKVLF